MKCFSPFIMFLAFLITLAFPPSLFSQDFGSYSPNIRWNQINTKSVKVVFPEGLEKAANRVANNLVYIDNNKRTTIGSRSKRLSLILNNQGVISNGYVTLMPFHSEFFTTPFQASQVLGSLPWLDLLSVHEYRHALQFSNFNQGLTKLGYILGGQQIWAIAANLTAPNWYFEGDAVTTETALTNQGRGRMPSFFTGYKSILSTGNRFSYNKARNGSYKDDVPDHYRLGYLLCKYGREEYGDDLWMKVISRTANFKGIIFPFSNAVQHFTNHSTNSLYKVAMDKYEKEWGVRQDKIIQLPDSTISKEFQTVTHYKYPVFEKARNNLLVNKSSYKRTKAIYELSTDGTESMIVEMGITQDAYFSGSANYLCWTELSWDKRFSSISYSDIVLYNRNNKKLHYITEKQRLFSPDISVDESQIVAVEASSDLKSHIVIIDAQSGEIIQKIPNPESYYFTYPKWDIETNYIISSGRSSKGEMFIARINLLTGETKMLVDPGNNIIGSVSPGKNKVYFSASFGGKDDIYSVDRTRGEIEQLTDSQFGAYYPTVDTEGKTIVYTTVIYNGQDVKLLELNQAMGKRVSPIGLNQIKEFSPAFADIEGGNILDQIPDTVYPVKSYRPFLNSLKFHSWSPTFKNTLTSIGLALQSDNILNNLHLEAGADYYLNEVSPGFSIAAVFGKWLPVISLGLNQQYRHPGITELNEPGDWERSFSAGLQVPLNLSHGTFQRSFLAEANIDRTTVPINHGDDLSTGNNFHFTSVSIHSKAVTTKLRAYQNITTPFGAGVEFVLNQSFSGIRASQLQFYADGAIRGLFPNHNLVIGLSGKIENHSNPYQYLDQNVYPRGYTIPQNDIMIGLSTNYYFPIMYPDVGLRGIIYFLRLRGNLFTDIAQGQIITPSGDLNSQQFLSAGSELIFDTKVFNMLPMSIGIRYSYLAIPDLMSQGKSGKFELFIPIIRL